MQYQLPTLIIIAGPTAIGKTGVAINVARHFNTVILSADSRQCYKELNIGVARPQEEELKAVPHYFIASHHIHDDINAGRYEKYALDLLKDLFALHPIVVVTGGTGLYIKALVEGMDAMPEIPAEIRNNILEGYKTFGISWLQQQLQLKDPEFASAGEMQNPQRMMRALEVAEATGRPGLSFRTVEKEKRRFNILQIALQMPREQLYDRINLRVDAMMLAGLEDEARNLYPYRHKNALQTVGYKELFDYFDGSISKDEAVKLIKQHTRNYAKRQITWFKKQKDIYAINVDENIIAFIEKHLVEK